MVWDDKPGWRVFDRYGDVLFVWATDLAKLDASWGDRFPVTESSLARWLEDPLERGAVLDVYEAVTGSPRRMWHGLAPEVFDGEVTRAVLRALDFGELLALYVPPPLAAIDKKEPDVPVDPPTPVDERIAYPLIQPVHSSDDAAPPAGVFALNDSPAGAGATPAATPAAAAPKAKSAPVVGPGKLVAFVKRPGVAQGPAQVHLKTDIAFDGVGVFTRSDTNIDFFRKGSATPLKFDGTDNQFKGADLTAGIDLDATAVKASAKSDEITLTLTLKGGSVKAGSPATSKATAVEVTLDISEPRVNTATEPVKLPTLGPAAAAPAPAAATDKFFLGRPLPLQGNPKVDERAVLVVQKVKPADFKGTLVLKAEDDKVALFTNEEVTAGEAPRVLPEEIDIAGIPAAGKKFFVEGAKASGGARDTGVTIGLKGMGGIADHVKITVCHTETCSNKKPADLPVVAQAPEKPARATKSTFVPAPLIMGLKYDVEMRPFLALAVPKAFQWQTTSDKIKLKDPAKEVVGCHGEKLSAALDDVLLEVILTTDIGKLKKRHKMTVVRVEMSPITTGDNLVHTDPINKIENPSGCVVLSGGEAGDTAKVPIFKITKIEPDLGWTDDDTRLAWWVLGGQPKADEKYDGKADFHNNDKSKYGKKIQVFGTQRGDVLVQPYSGGYGYGMFRTHVVPIHRVKFRINRIFTQAQPAHPVIPALPEQLPQPPFPGSGAIPAQPAVPHLPAVAARPAQAARAARAPTASAVEAELHMKVVNIYLRQAGIEMIPDDSLEGARATRPARPALPAVAAQAPLAAQIATPALPGPPPVAPQAPVAARPAVPDLPAVPGRPATAANDKVGKAALDGFVESVTQVKPGIFDVEVNHVGLTFAASGPKSNDAIKINARNEVITFAYIHSQASAGALATALLCPWNHAPRARANPPLQPYSVANYTLTDKSSPSSSLIPKTGIPDNVPVDPVKMNVLAADMAWEGSSPATRKEELLWGVIVPTVTIDASVSGAPTPDRIRLAYGNTLAHELGHVFGLGHRGGGGVPDGLMIPAGENLMHPSNPPPQAENIDIIQVKAIRFSEALFRTP